MNEALAAEAGVYAPPLSAQEAKELGDLAAVASRAINMPDAPPLSAQEDAYGLPTNQPEAEHKGPPPLFNREAIRRHAIKVSIETRNGKFSRVSQEFIDSVIAAAEAKIRAMSAEVLNTAFGQVDPDGEEFLTGAGKKFLAERFNVWVAREIHRQANNVRTGKTL